MVAIICLIISGVAGYSYILHEPLDFSGMKKVEGTLNNFQASEGKKIKFFKFYLNQYGNTFVVGKPYSEAIDFKKLESNIKINDPVEIYISDKYKNTLSQSKEADNIPGVYAMKINNKAYLSKTMSIETDKKNNMSALYLAIGCFIVALYLVFTELKERKNAKQS